MDTWIWVAIIAVAALALFALAWWSSGRAKPLSRGPENTLTQGQIEELSRFQGQNQHGGGGGGGVG
jgi:hypothetical protein